MDFKSYRYYDKNTCGFDAAGCFEDLMVSICVCLITFFKKIIQKVYAVFLLTYFNRVKVFLENLLRNVTIMGKLYVSSGLHY